MKCILLLAAVYSLIIHQWHKDKGTTLVSSEQVKGINQPNIDKTASSVSFTANTQFFALNALLNLNKR